MYQFLTLISASVGLILVFNEWLICLKGIFVNQLHFFKVNLFIVVTVVLILDVDLLKCSCTFSQTQ